MSVRAAPVLVYWVAALAAAFNTPVRAISPELMLNQLGHTAWRVQDGVLPGRPTKITQTKDGYVWIGTESGLVRFDGVAFVTVTPPADLGPHRMRVTALYGANDGSLWVGSYYLLHWQRGQFHVYPKPYGVFRDFREGPRGELWGVREHTADDRGALCKIQTDEPICYGAGQGLPIKNAHALLIEKSGAFWIAAAEKLVRWAQDQAQVFAPPALSHDQGLDGFKAVIADPDGSIWSGVAYAGPGLGLQHFANGTWMPAVSGNFDSSRWKVACLMFDRDNTLWVGTEDDGIYRIGAAGIDHFGVTDGLSSDSLHDLLEDHEGNVWAVTTLGVDKFRPMQVVTVSTRQGLSSDEADAVLASRSGAVWVSNATALDRIEHGTVKSYGQRQGLPGQAPTALFEDSRGRLWFGIDDDIALFANEHFTRLAAPKGHPGPIRQFAETADSVWAITATPPSQLIRMSDTEVQELIPAPAGFRMDALATTADGTLWTPMTGRAGNCDLFRYSKGGWEQFPLHTAPGSGACNSLVALDAHTLVIAENAGIATWRDGVVHYFGVDQGLPCPTVHGLAVDQHSSLWLYMQCGVGTIELQQLLDGSITRSGKLRVRLLDTTDGGLPANADFCPNVSVGIDGKIWFANSADVQFVDPRHSPGNTVEPPVHVQALRGDGHSYDLGSSVTLPALTRDVQIDFTAPSFSVPQRVQFQYRLDGWDKQWQHPVGRRQALYSNLPPGRYRFSVVAANDAGLWNLRGDSLDFTVKPAYFQTWWFKVLCVVSILALLQTAYAYRLRLAKADIRRRLAARLSEREKIARDLHDTLLQSVQGLLLKFGAVTSSIPAESTARNKLESVLRQADEVIAEGRARVRGLRGEDLPSMNLAERLSAHGSTFLQTSDTAFEVSMVGQAVPLNPVAADEVLNIAREAINNAFNHAQALLIEVEVTYDNKALTLKVRDDGKGMEQETTQSGRGDHWGLLGMRERAKSVGGKLTIWSRPGSGTEVELTLPAGTAYARIAAATKPGWVTKLLRAMGLRHQGSTLV